MALYIENVERLREAQESYALIYKLGLHYQSSVFSPFWFYFFFPKELKKNKNQQNLMNRGSRKTNKIEIKQELWHVRSLELALEQF